MTAEQERSKAEVVAAIESNLYTFGTTQFVKWPRIDCYDEPHLLWFECDVPSAMFNVVHRARFSRENAAARISAVKSRYAGRSVPFVWWVEPSSTPQDLSRYLTAAEFVPAGEMTGMATALTGNWKRKTEQDNRYAPDVDVRPVVGEESLKVFARTMCAGFEMEEAIVEPMIELALAMGHGTDGPLVNYLAYENGRAAATSSLFIDGDVAGIYNVATVPEARRRGLGRAVTLAAMSEAARRGCEEAVLHASAMAVPLYRSLGFDITCYFHQYLWPPGRD